MGGGKLVKSSTGMFVACVAGALVIATAAFTTGYSTAAQAAKAYPNVGWTIHIDAQRHFPGNKQVYAHHFCRGVRGGWTECQLYESDDANARMVGAEFIVSPAIYKTFSKAEQASWHWHKVELPKVNGKMPDMTKAEAAKVVKQITDTYGKVILFYDPTKQDVPTGSPLISIVN